MRAWKTEGCGITSVVFATSRGRARLATQLSANEAGYRLKFTEVRVTRWPNLDATSRGWPENTPLDPDVVSGVDP